MDAVVLAVEMEPPVRIKITIGGQGAQLEQGLASSQAQSRSGEIESVGDQDGLHDQVVRNASGRSSKANPS
ncbi:MAG: hypothetical protein JWN52_631 [Actinomycetia bacterium]|nr:hypothetical protein [Actinomycetes bacterium]